MRLQDAVQVLNDLASATLVDDRSCLIRGALALNTVTLNSNDRDFADAAIGLQLLAIGVKLDLDEHSRKRADFLARPIQTLISGQPRK
jgi:hypothetical protein